MWSGSLRSQQGSVRNAPIKDVVFPPKKGETEPQKHKQVARAIGKTYDSESISSSIDSNCKESDISILGERRQRAFGRRKLVGLSLILFFLFIMGITMTLYFVLNGAKDDENLTEYQVKGKLKIMNWDYSDKLSDPSSLEYLHRQDLLCNQIHLAMETGKLSQHKSKCRVELFQSGSVVAHFGVTILESAAKTVSGVASALLDAMATKKINGLPIFEDLQIDLSVLEAGVYLDGHMTGSVVYPKAKPPTVTSTKTPETTSAQPDSGVTSSDSSQPDSGVTSGVSSQPDSGVTSDHTAEQSTTTPMPFPTLPPAPTGGPLDLTPHEEKIDNKTDTRSQIPNERGLEKEHQLEIKGQEENRYTKESKTGRNGETIEIKDKFVSMKFTVADFPIDVMDPELLGRDEDGNYKANAARLCGDVAKKTVSRLPFVECDSYRDLNPATSGRSSGGTYVLALNAVFTIKNTRISFVEEIAGDINAVKNGIIALFTHYRSIANALPFEVTTQYFFFVFDTDVSKDQITSAPSACDGSACPVEQCVTYQDKGICITKPNKVLSNGNMNIVPLYVDDGSEAMTLPYAFPFGSTLHNTIHISTNGLVSFGSNFIAPCGSPFPKATGDPAMIAAFWADGDFTNSLGDIIYEVEAGSRSVLDTNVLTMIDTYRASSQVFDARMIISVKWYLADPTFGDIMSKGNTFTLILVASEFESYVIYNYVSLNWGTNNFGGCDNNPNFRIGYDNGLDYFNHPHSGDAASLGLLVTGSNIGAAGYWVYKFDNKFDLKCFDTDVDVLRGYPSAGNSSLLIFNEFSLGCTGRIISWELAVSDVGTVLLGVWRPTGNGNEYKMVGKNTIVVYNSTIEVMKYDVPAHEQISVQPGDKFGIFYATSGSRPIVPLDINPDSPCCGQSADQFSRYWSFPNKYNSDLVVGDVYQLTALSSDRILPPVKAYYAASEQPPDVSTLLNFGEIWGDTKFMLGDNEVRKLPFSFSDDFPFGNEKKYSDVWLGANGYLVFDNDPNIDVPCPAEESNFADIFFRYPMVAAFWSDFNPELGGAIYVREDITTHTIQILSEVACGIWRDQIADEECTYKPTWALIVTWYNMKFINQPSLGNTFQVVLHTDGNYAFITRSLGKMESYVGENCFSMTGWVTPDAKHFNAYMTNSADKFRVWKESKGKEITDFVGHQKKPAYCLGAAGQVAPLVHYPLMPPPGSQFEGKFIAYLDIAFQCAGAVTTWEVYAVRTGNVVMGVWRPINNNTKLAFVGSNILAIIQRGREMYAVDESEQITVEVGDIISTQYIGATDLIISFDYQPVGNDGCCGLTANRYSQYVLSTDIDLEAGNEIPSIPYVDDRVVFPAIRAVVGDVIPPPENILFPYGAGVGDDDYPLEDDYVWNIELTAPLPFFGRFYKVIQITDNGMISFGDAEGYAYCGKVGYFPYRPAIFLLLQDGYLYGHPDANIFFRESTQQSDIEKATEQLCNDLKVCDFKATHTIVITYSRVPGFQNDYRKTFNTFQLVIAHNGSHSYGMQHYDVLQYEKSHSVSGCYSRVGYVSGNGLYRGELDTSQFGSILSLQTSSNVGRKGVFIFSFGEAYVRESVLYSWGSDEGDKKFKIFEEGYLPISTQPFTVGEEMYSTIYMHPNGYVLFRYGLNYYCADVYNLPGEPIVAAFFSDIDVGENRDGAIYYREITDPANPLFEMARHDICLKKSKTQPDLTMEKCDFKPNWAFVLTFYKVAKYRSDFYYDDAFYISENYGNVFYEMDEDPANTFQTVLVSDGLKTFVIFNYDTIEWGEAWCGMFAGFGYSYINDNKQNQWMGEIWAQTGYQAMHLPEVTNVDQPGRLVAYLGERNFCLERPCKNGGTCIRLPHEQNGFKCFCENPWTGEDCTTSVYVNSCALRNGCGEGNVCVDKSPFYSLCKCAGSSEESLDCGDSDKCSPIQYLHCDTVLSYHSTLNPHPDHPDNTTVQIAQYIAKKMSYYQALENPRCFDTAKHFLCGYYNPYCNERTGQVTKTCRSSCNAYLRDCGLSGDKAWEANCLKLPDDTDPNGCYDFQNPKGTMQFFNWVRQVNGLRSVGENGRVEVYYAHSWWTVCDKDWDVYDATVVCNSQGYQSVGTPTRGSYFGSGALASVTESVNCYGHEQNVLQCENAGWGVGNCSARNQAGVFCNVSVDEDFEGDSSRPMGYTNIWHPHSINFAYEFVLTTGEGATGLDRPIRDATTGKSSGHYMYAKLKDSPSSWAKNISALFSPAVRPPPNGGCLRFKYYMNGAGVITVSQYMRELADRPMWSVSGDKGTPWTEAQVTLPKGLYQIAIFAYISELGEVANIALDDFQLSDKPCGTVRLSGGTPRNGYLEVFYSGQWGSVCDDLFDMTAASVACRQLGFKGGAEFTVNPIKRTNIASMPIWLDDLRCSCGHSSLDLCEHNGWGLTDCNTDHSEDVWLTCHDEICEDGFFNLERGDRGVSSSITGTKVDGQHTDKECSDMCLAKTFEECPAFKHIVSSGECWLFDVMVQVTDLIPEPGTNTFQRYKCSEAMLEGGTDQYEGYPIIINSGIKESVICADAFTEDAARVICKMLFNKTVEVEIFRPDHFGTKDTDYSIHQLTCPCEATHFSQCDYKISFLHKCQSAAFRCLVPVPMDVRLVDGLPGDTEMRSGRLEVLFQGQWGTVCDDHVDDNLAQIVCTKLGFTQGPHRTVAGMFPPADDSVPIYFDDLRCPDKTASTLLECDFGTFNSQHNCRHNEDVGIICNDVANDAVLEVRLVNSNIPKAGTVQVRKHGGEWGNICDDFWQDVDATVICRMVLDNFKGVGKAFSNGYNTSLSGRMEESPNFHMDDVQCSQGATDLRFCSHRQWGVHNCRNNELAGVRCDQNPGDMIRLTGGSSSKEGTVEVLHNGIWGAVCGRDFDDRDATVVCRTKGYDKGHAYAFENAWFGQSRGPVWLTGIECNGDEENFFECIVRGYEESQCNRKRDAGVICENEKPNDFAVRLGDSLQPYEGRLEIFHNGIWGTTCNFENNLLAHVACREMYGEGMIGNVHGTRPSIHEDAFDMPIWFDGYFCYREEKSLADCPHRNGWGITWECSHSDDVYIKCFPEDRTTPAPEKPSIPVRLTGMDYYAGRLEVLYDNVWGTVCDHDFHDFDAFIVCKQLGIQSPGSRALRGSEVPNAPDSVRMWFDSLYCPHDAQELKDCTHNGWGSTFCRPDQNVGVWCRESDTPPQPPNVGRQCFQHPIIVKECAMADWKTYQSRPDQERMQALLDHHNMRKSFTDYCYRYSGAFLCSFLIGECNAEGDLIRPCKNFCMEYFSKCRESLPRDLQSWEIFCHGLPTDNTYLTPCNDKYFWDYRSDLLNDEVCNGHECEDSYGYSTCISYEWVCDGRPDCRDKSDEANCGNNPSVSCGIEDDGYVLCGWFQEMHPRDNMDWHVQTGSTPSHNTGPNADHTLNNPQGHYIFIKTSTRNSWSHGYVDFAKIISPLIEITTSHCFQFYYHMSGNDIGELILNYKYESGEEQRLWNKYADQGPAWKTAMVDLSMGKFYLVFEGRHYYGYQGDIALDDFFLTEGRCTPEDFSIRLAGGPSHNVGRLEVQVLGEWGTVCQSGFDGADAAVACRQLGYYITHGALPLENSKVGPGNGSVWLTDLRCRGNEASLSQCEHKGWGWGSCSHYSDVGVHCFTDPIITRLVGSDKPGRGRLEMYFETEWITFCNSFWSQSAVDVACKTQGFEGPGKIVKPGSFVNKNRQMSIVPQCKGQESHLRECEYNLDYSTDYHSAQCPYGQNLWIECSETKPGPDMSCEDRYLAGMDVSDPFLYDPDGEGGVEPFLVECDTSKSPVAMVIYTNFYGGQSYHNVDTYMGSNIKYYSASQEELSHEQIRAFVNSSLHCEQAVEFSCVSVDLLATVGYVPYGSSTENGAFHSWSKLHGSPEICPVKDGKERLCNCDGLGTLMKTDQGTIIDRNVLPLSKLVWDAKLTPNGNYLKCSLGPLTCFAGKASKYSCSERVFRGMDIARRIFLDVDGDSGPLAPMIVSCDPSTKYMTTVIHHNQEGTVLVDKFAGIDSYKVPIEYIGAPLESIASLVDPDLGAFYQMELQCSGTDLYKENHLVAYDGSIVGYDSLTGTFCPSKDQCQCAQNKEVLAIDKGTLFGTTEIPFRAMMWGGTGGSLEYLYYNLGHLHVYGKLVTHCSFESNNLCGFTNVESPEDKLQWIINKDQTVSSGTGPDDDHTLIGEGYYIYVEGSDPANPGWNALLASPVISPGADWCVRLYYHMYGQHMGSLNVHQRVSGQMKKICSVDGPQKNEWRLLSCKLEEAEDSQFYVEAVRGSGYKSDIAVDDIAVITACQESACNPGEFGCAGTGDCIPESRVCDNYPDCDDGLDEQSCAVTDKDFLCKDGVRLPSAVRCNGVYNCEDWSDEVKCEDCDSGDVCPNGVCLKNGSRCDGVNDCGDWSDEKTNCNCSERTPRMCGSTGKCYSEADHCDWWTTCEDGTDMKFCSLDCDMEAGNSCGYTDMWGKGFDYKFKVIDGEEYGRSSMIFAAVYDKQTKASYAMFESEVVDNSQKGCLQFDYLVSNTKLVVLTHEGEIDLGLDSSNLAFSSTGTQDKWTQRRIDLNPRASLVSFETQCTPGEYGVVAFDNFRHYKGVSCDVLTPSSCDFENDWTCSFEKNDYEYMDNNYGFSEHMPGGRYLATRKDAPFNILSATRYSFYEDMCFSFDYWAVNGLYVLAGSLYGYEDSMYTNKTSVFKYDSLTAINNWNKALVNVPRGVQFIFILSVPSDGYYIAIDNIALVPGSCGDVPKYPTVDETLYPFQLSTSNGCKAGECPEGLLGAPDQPPTTASPPGCQGCATSPHAKPTTTGPSYTLPTTVSTPVYPWPNSTMTSTAYPSTVPTTVSPCGGPGCPPTQGLPGNSEICLDSFTFSPGKSALSLSVNGSEVWDALTSATSCQEQCLRLPYDDCQAFTWHVANQTCTTFAQYTEIYGSGGMQLFKRVRCPRGETCAVAVSDRVECGNGLDMHQCDAQNCCFDANSKLCYQPGDVCELGKNNYFVRNKNQASYWGESYYQLSQEECKGRCESLMECRKYSWDPFTRTCILPSYRITGYTTNSYLHYDRFNCPTRFHYLSCNMRQRYGLDISQPVTYDPDGMSGPLPPLRVECDDSTTPVSTIVHHNLEQPSQMTDPTLSALNKDIVYYEVPDMESLKLLVAQSMKCSYDLKLSSKGVDVNTAIRWFDRNDNEMKLDQIKNGNLCLNQTEEDFQRICQCSQNNDMECYEDGTIEDWDKLDPILPITKFTIGGTTSNTFAGVLMGPLRCQLPEMCVDSFMPDPDNQGVIGARTVPANSKDECRLQCLSVPRQECARFTWSHDQGKCYLIQEGEAVTILPTSADTYNRITCSYDIDAFSCNERQAMGMDISEPFPYDVDGDGPLPALWIECDPTTKPITTLIRHDQQRENLTSLDNSYSSKSQHRFIYPGVINMGSLDYLVDQSESCEYEIEFECQGVSLRWDLQVLGRGYSPLSWHQLGRGSLCPKLDEYGNRVCNCMDSAGGMKKDSGTVKMKEIFPLTAFSFSGVDQPGDHMAYKIGPLRCQMKDPDLYSCNEREILGMDNSRPVLYDVDGPGGKPAMLVECDTSTNPVTTVIRHSQMKANSVQNGTFGPDQYMAPIMYKGVADIGSVSSLVTGALSCSYTMAFSCMSADFKQGAHFYDMDFNKKSFETDISQGSLCKMDLSTGKRMCKCFEDDLVLHADGGTIEDKDKMPLRMLTLGGIKGFREYIEYQVGPLRCQLPDPDTLSCNQRKAVGLPLSGPVIYDADGPGGLPGIVVWCNDTADGVVTIIHHNLEETLALDDEPWAPKSYHALIRYTGVYNWESLTKLVDRSLRCSYEVEMSCQNVLLYAASHFYDRNFQEKSWNYQLGNGTLCKPGQGPNSDVKHCNCFEETGELKTDIGTVEEKSQFPWRLLTFGDTEDSDEFMYFRLGALKCHLPDPEMMSCNERKRAGLDVVGRILYDPDGKGPLPALVATCDQRTFPISTVISHDLLSGQRIPVANYKPDQFKLDIKYLGVKDMASLNALIDQSQACSYDVYVDCRQVALDKSSSWYGRNSIKYTWDKDIIQGTLCGGDNGGAVRECNCFENSGEIAKDRGTMENKDSFPIMALTFGDKEGDADLWIKLGPLRCQIPDKPLPPMWKCMSVNDFIPVEFRCDGLLDCVDGTDEFGCNSTDTTDHCDFEKDCDFIVFDQPSVNSSVFWRNHAGQTPTPSTGPLSSREHWPPLNILGYFMHTDIITGVTPGTRYVYLETSYGKEGDMASFTMDATGKNVLRFQYAMYGKDIGALRVVGGNNAEERVLWALYSNQVPGTLIGQSSFLWQSTQVLIPESYTFVRFEGIGGDGDRGDIALDTVVLTADRSRSGGNLPGCPGGHHQCGSGTCLLRSDYYCDGVQHCNDGSDELDHICNVPKCRSYEWYCPQSKHCIYAHYVCDVDYIDCKPYGEDESPALCGGGGRDGGGGGGGSGGSLPEPTLPPIPPCPSYKFQCKVSHKCIKQAYFCDGHFDCMSQNLPIIDYSDENECQDPFWRSLYKFSCPVEGIMIPKSWRCNNYVDCRISMADEIGCECRENEWRCEKNPKCINIEMLCNNVEDCGEGDASDEKNCPAVNVCKKDQFRCDDGTCIPASYACNKHYDCVDRSDEKACTEKDCDWVSFFCDGRCVHVNFYCDGIFHCKDGSDEPEGCTHHEKQILCDNGLKIPSFWYCDGYYDCRGSDITDESPGCSCVDPDSTFYCEADKVCLTNDKKCNGVRDCSDYQDEKYNCSVPEGKFRCPMEGTLIDIQFVCDGTAQCKDRADEYPTCECDPELQFKCNSSGLCLPKSYVCNGFSDCDDASDELGADCFCPIGMKKCGSGECYSHDQACDGTFNCQSFDDELNCKCQPHQFTCGSGLCISKDWVCDTQNDCGDFSDENQCVCEFDQFRCNNGQCISKWHRCDGVQDCKDGEDESPICQVEKCSMLRAPIEDYINSTSNLNMTSVRRMANDLGIHLCHDYSCITSKWICDGYVDCADATDEQQCIKAPPLDLTNRVVNVPTVYHAGKHLPVCASVWNEAWANAICDITGEGYAIDHSPISMADFDVTSGVLEITRTYPPMESHYQYFKKVDTCSIGRLAAVTCKGSICGTTTVPLRRPDTYIVGPSSKPAQLGQWPWQVEIYYAGSFRCGGVILDERHVLTASHCVMQWFSTPYIKSYVTLRVGNIKKYGGVDVNPYLQELNIDAIIRHSNYVTEVHPYNNDIAIIKTAEVIKFNNYVRPVCLPKQGDNPFKYKDCFISGYGKTSGRYTANSENLLYARTYINSDKFCTDYFDEATEFGPYFPREEQYYPEFQLCAGANVPAASCAGETGGPLVCRDSNDKWVQIGISSWGRYDCRVDAPDYYVRVSSYVDWIQAILDGKNEKNTIRV